MSIEEITTTSPVPSQSSVPSAELDNLSIIAQYEEDIEMLLAELKYLQYIIACGQSTCCGKAVYMKCPQCPQCGYTMTIAPANSAVFQEPEHIEEED